MRPDLSFEQMSLGKQSHFSHFAEYLDRLIKATFTLCPAQEIYLLHQNFLGCGLLAKQCHDLVVIVIERHIAFTG